MINCLVQYLYVQYTFFIKILQLPNNSNTDFNLKKCKQEMTYAIHR